MNHRSVAASILLRLFNTPSARRAAFVLGQLSGDVCPGHTSGAEDTNVLPPVAVAHRYIPVSEVAVEPV